MLPKKGLHRPPICAFHLSFAAQFEKIGKMVKKLVFFDLCFIHVLTHKWTFQGNGLLYYTPLAVGLARLGKLACTGHSARHIGRV